MRPLSNRSLLVCCAIVFALVVGLLRATLGGGAQGPPSSSYATDADGLAAWAELLSRDGHPIVQLGTALAQARLEPADTVVVLNPDALLHADGEELLRFVEAGGRLVIGGSDPQGTLPAVIARPPEWRASAALRQRPSRAGEAALPGVHEVLGAGEGEWAPSSGYRALLSNPRGALLLQRSLGRGTIELLADASPLQNRLLASGDNALLGLDLSGGARRTVVFVESVHGYGVSRGLAAIPQHWWLAFAGLALAGLLWILARGRRLGPAEPTRLDATPPRSAYLEALALLLARSRDPQELAAALARLRDGR